MTIQHHPLFEHTPVLSNNFDYWCRDDFVDCDFDDNFWWHLCKIHDTRSMMMIYDDHNDIWYMIYDDHDDIYCWTCLILIYDDLIWYVLCFMICFMIWYDMFNLDIWWSWWYKLHDDDIWCMIYDIWRYKLHDDDIYCWTCLIFMLMLMLDLWLQAETPGVTHFGAYHRPPDGHF